MCGRGERRPARQSVVIAAQNGATVIAAPGIDDAPAQPTAVESPDAKAVQECQDRGVADQGLVVMLQECGILALELRGLCGMRGAFSGVVPFAWHAQED